VHISVQSTTTCMYFNHVLQDLWLNQGNSISNSEKRIKGTFKLDPKTTKLLLGISCPIHSRLCSFLLAVVVCQRIIEGSLSN